MESQPLTYFVSYSRADEAFALDLAEKLLAEDVNLWIDQLNILPGDRWDRAIEDALESSQGLLVLLSSTSVESDNVMDEVSYALEQGKQVIPVLFEVCEIPFRLRRLQYIDLISDFEKGLARLVKNLKVISTAESSKKLQNEPLNTSPQKSEAAENHSEVVEPSLVSQHLQATWANKPWRRLAYLGLGLVTVVAVVAFSRSLWKGPSKPENILGKPSKPEVVPSPDAETIDAIETALESSEKLADTAINRTEEIRSQPWDNNTFDREWGEIGELWEDAANQLATFLPLRSQSTNIANLVETRLQPRHQEYLNRQVLTSAMYAHYKSIFLAYQPEEESPEQCDSNAIFADSREKWEPILALRQQALAELDSVSKEVSFHSREVSLARENYEENLDWATKFYQSSPWYYAIQKAVCAIEWEKKAKESNARDDWMQSATFWKRGIERLKNAPPEIPLEIPQKNREMYQSARDNLGLWERNLKNAEARVTP